MIYAYGDDALYVASIEGQKIEMMRANPRVCFEVDTYSDAGWRSAIVQGVYEELTKAQTLKALALLRSRFGLRPRQKPTGRKTVCFRIAVQSVTGRGVRR